MEKISQSEYILKILALCGLVPILDALVFGLLGALEPNYNPILKTISELGATDAQTAPIASLYFIISGILLVAFSIGLYLGIREGKDPWAWIGPVLISMFGIGRIGSGIFPCDPDCLGHTFTGMMHLNVIFIGILGIILAPFFIWRTLEEDEQWQGYQTFSLIIGIIGLLALFTDSFLNVLLNKILIGLTQRMFYGIYQVWILVLAV
ncbi:MAG: DUF998 domain-containing protein, partial [Candidatus Hodarchaeota archaeon]